jgi:uncharacterized protein YjbJ (UPF0337 family)
VLEGEKNVDESTDDDIQTSRGNVENLIGRIKEKTGETADNIRAKLDEWFGDDSNQHPSATSLTAKRNATRGWL